MTDLEKLKTVMDTKRAAHAAARAYYAALDDALVAARAYNAARDAYNAAASRDALAAQNREQDA